MFFGIVIAGDDVFAFRHRAPTAPEGAFSGELVRFSWDAGELVEHGVIADGLHYSCHQLAHFEGELFLVDTWDQSIRVFGLSGAPSGVFRLLPPARPDGPDHAHINSIEVADRRIRVMFHNGKRTRPSEIAEFDRRFVEQGRFVLPCDACHDIVSLPGGRTLTCLSPRGEIGVFPGEPVKIDALWTRGLVVSDDEVAVGSSLYGKRLGRTLLPGFVTFLAPDLTRTGRLYLPAAPTQIQRLAFDPEADATPPPAVPPRRGPRSPAG